MQNYYVDHKKFGNVNQLLAMMRRLPLVETGTNTAGLLRIPSPQVKLVDQLRETLTMPMYKETIARAIMQ